MNGFYNLGGKMLVCLAQIEYVTEREIGLADYLINATNNVVDADDIKQFFAWFSKQCAGAPSEPKAS